MNILIDDGDIIIICISNFQHRSRGTCCINPPLVGKVSYDNSLYDYYTGPFNDNVDLEYAIYTSRKLDDVLYYSWSSRIHGVTSAKSIVRLINSTILNMRFDLDDADATMPTQEFWDRVKCET
jgi:hypothetical protein